MTEMPPDSPGGTRSLSWTLFWTIVRLVFGWLSIVAGLILFPLPLPLGLPLLILGIVLVGPRDPVLRWARVRLKILIRYCATLSHPILGPVGRFFLNVQRKISRQWRKYARSRKARKMSAQQRMQNFQKPVSDEPWDQSTDPSESDSTS
jgi:hypothetical protein